MTGAQIELLDAVDAICRRFPASVTSWWRSAKHNASLPGSVPNSQHQQGLAVDLVFDGPTPSKGELAPFLSRTMQDVRDEPGHVHLEQDPKLLARAARGIPASATSHPFPSEDSDPLSSKRSVSSASAYAPAAGAHSEGALLTTAPSARARGGPGSSPIDLLFHERRRG
jgi:Peptidase M15